MAMEFIVEIIRKQLIKPSSPTPLSLKNFKLSLLEQLIVGYYTPAIFCYTNNTEASAAADGFAIAKAEARSQVLKKSLSETLSRFYPFSGRIGSHSLIECNDEGVDFIEARVNCLLQDIIKQPDGESLRKLLPVQTAGAGSSQELVRGQILLIQVNFFKCGGMLIGVSYNHKIIDLSTLNLFIKTWAAITKGTSHEVISSLTPVFETSSSLFPPLDSLPHHELKTDHEKIEKKKVVSRRLVFDATSISMLKAEAASEDVPLPTRVEAVTALVWKCARAAATSNRGGLKRPSVLLQAVNLRKAMDPPLPENSIGNLVFGMTAYVSDYETELHSLVKKFRSGISGFRENLVRKLIQNCDAASTILENGKEVGKYLSKGDEVDFYIGNSMCRLEGYKSADFGWGKPRWICHYNMIESPIGFACQLVDAKDGVEGIEAWVTLSEDHMTFFERNKQLLAFASVNPINFVGECCVYLSESIF